MIKKFFFLASLLFISIQSFAQQELVIKLKIVDSLYGEHFSISVQNEQKILQQTRSILEKIGAAKGTELSVRALGFVLAKFNSNDTSLISRLKADQRVSIVAKNIQLKQTQFTNSNLGTANPHWNYQMQSLGAPNSANLSAIDLPGAWNLARQFNTYDSNNGNIPGNTGVVVAVVDSGIVYEHPDLSDRILPGYDFVSNVNNSLDGNGRDSNASDVGDGSYCVDNDIVTPSSWHGTMVSGIIAAIPNNNEGIAGINGDVKILPVRVLGRCRAGSLADVMDGAAWAAGISISRIPNNPYPARIINMSLGAVENINCTTGIGDEVRLAQDIINKIREAGPIIVAASGNENADVGFPSNCNGVVSVASLDVDGLKAAYSNTGARISISAPGGNYIAKMYTFDPEGNNGKVFSTSNAGETYQTAHTYQGGEGTSFAAPMVSGVAALMLSINPNLTGDELISRIKSAVRPFITAPSTIERESELAAQLDVGKKFCTIGETLITGTPTSGSTDSITTFCGSGMLDARQGVIEALRPSIFITKTINTDGSVTLDASGSKCSGSCTFAWTPPAGICSGSSCTSDATSGDLRIDVTDSARPASYMASATLTDPFSTASTIPARYVADTQLFASGRTNTQSTVTLTAGVRSDPLTSVLTGVNLSAGTTISSASNGGGGAIPLSLFLAFVLLVLSGAYIDTKFAKTLVKHQRQ